MFSLALVLSEIFVKKPNDQSNSHHVKNMQGDVVALADTSGQMVVQYTYDAWGNMLSTTGSMANTLGLVNPLRYRSYFYDIETSLYYVNSRYYNPTTARWLCIDRAVSGIGGNICGYNLFAYCFNNPVNCTDNTGTWPKWLEKLPLWQVL